MPELPEVETVMRGIAPALLGRRILRATARRPDLRWPLPPRFGERLQGRVVSALSRRSKYILAQLDDGATWVLHLGMSGRIALSARDPAAPSALVGAFALPAPAAGADPDAALGPHDHVVVETDHARLIYTDARRFGAMDLVAPGALATHKWFARLGPEPLSADFDADFLAARLAGRGAPIKALLLDQRLVAGLGNIYVCESLWRARVAPTRPGGAVSRREAAALTRAIRRVLTEAIEAGGSSLRDHRQVDGDLGYFQHRFAVYGRAGDPCRRSRCRGVVTRIAQSGRSSFFCPGCQR